MIDEIIKFAFKEDLGNGDHTSLSCVPESAVGKAKLLLKDDGVIAGVELAEKIFHHYDPTRKITQYIQDGEKVKFGDIVFVIDGNSRSILATECLVLKFMQSMSAIATQTRAIVDSIAGTHAKLLFTRKPYPGTRVLETWAVKIGVGHN